ncbi:MAG: radical SAM protein [Candidatus Adiutrix sp.]|nr:radical SAM protein [Candidatus Adiutrix sp.]
MAALVAASNMLNYPEHRHRTLRYLAKLLWQMGHAGEAYQAALALPAEERADCAGIIKAVEVDEVPARQLAFNLEIITHCNLRCPMCSNGNGRSYDEKGQIMSFPTFKRLWDKIRKRVNLLVLVGQGESFMHPNIYDILKLVAPTPVHIDTNANLKLDAERIVRSSLQTLIFSVDGVDQRTYEQYRVGGNFEKVLANIRAVVQAKKNLGRGPVTVFKYVVFKHNEAYLEEAEKLARQLGVDRFMVVPCLCVPEHSRELVNRLVPHGRHRVLSRIKYLDYAHGRVILNEGHDSPYCSAAMNNPNIKVEGTLTPCCSSSSRMGNLLESGFDEIWRSEPYREFRLNAFKNRFQLKDCNSCSRDANNLGRLFDGTVLEYPRRPAPSADILELGQLRVEADYAAYLLENNLTKDIRYFRDSGALSPEAEALLSGFRPGGDQPSAALAV